VRVPRGPCTLAGMKRVLVGLIACFGCGPSRPAVTVPAPTAGAEPAVPPAKPAAAEPPRARGADPAAAAQLPARELRRATRYRPQEHRVRRLDPESLAKLSERSRTIWLNARRLTVHKAVAQRSDGPEVALTATPRGDDFLELGAAEPLAPGAWTLSIDYAGELEA